MGVATTPAFWGFPSKLTQKAGVPRFQKQNGAPPGAHAPPLPFAGAAGAFGRLPGDRRPCAAHAVAPGPVPAGPDEISFGGLGGKTALSRTPVGDVLFRFSSFSLCFFVVVCFFSFSFFLEEPASFLLLFFLSVKLGFAFLLF